MRAISWNSGHGMADTFRIARNLAELGWAGCFIEGNSERFLELRKNYAARADIATVNAFVGAEGNHTLASILKTRGAPPEPTIVSIDIDGMDYHVWASLTAYQPLLFVVEFNPTIPARVVYVQENDEAVHRGASLRALWRLAQQKGYALVAATDWNGFFMREDLCQAQAVPTYAPEQVKDPRYETLLFHGFDGTLFAAGSRKLLWHDVEIGETDCGCRPRSFGSIHRLRRPGTPEHLHGLNVHAAGRGQVHEPDRCRPKCG